MSRHSVARMRSSLFLSAPLHLAFGDLGANVQRDAHAEVRVAGLHGGFEGSRVSDVVQKYTNRRSHPSRDGAASTSVCAPFSSRASTSCGPAIKQVVVGRHRAGHDASASPLIPEIAQVRCRLALLGRHQVALCAEHVVLAVDEHVVIAFRADVLAPVWPRAGIALVALTSRAASAHCRSP